ncbi:unnamed protein product [Staurois parvus]|uniref:Uncharacterized protein n=1 Tax=Staurois parvus TaxID=386267 RepID=A0ABN9D1N4_9NEOB|nr:unnamed protein product [Staurois parvus]
MLIKRPDGSAADAGGCFQTSPCIHCLCTLPGSVRHRDRCPLVSRRTQIAVWDLCVRSRFM